MDLHILRFGKVRCYDKEANCSGQKRRRRAGLIVKVLRTLKDYWCAKFKGTKNVSFQEHGVYRSAHLTNHIKVISTSINQPRLYFAPNPRIECFKSNTLTQDGCRINLNRCRNRTVPLFTRDDGVTSCKGHGPI